MMVLPSLCGHSLATETIAINHSSFAVDDFSDGKQRQTFPGAVFSSVLPGNAI
jgi:hypothetical protein